MLRFFVINAAVFIAALLTACGSKGTGVVVDAVTERYDLGERTEGSVRDVFSGVELIPLAFEGDYYPSRVKQLVVAGKYALVCDNKNVVHVFGQDGRYVSSSSSKLGNGPGEYSTLLGFTWNPYSETVELLTPDEMMSYDVNFNHVSSSKLPTSIGDDGVMYDRVFDLSATRHLLLPTGISKNPSRVLVYDSEEGAIEAEIPYGEDVVVETGMPATCFYRTGRGEVLFSPPSVTEHLYKVAADGGEMQKVVWLQPGRNCITKEDISRFGDDKSALNRYLINCEKEIPLRVLPSDESIFVLAKSGNSMNDMESLHIDRRTGKIVSVPIKRGDTRTFPILEDVDADYAYAIMEKESLAVVPELAMTDSIGIKEKLAEIEDESLVILKYKIKD